MENTKQTKRKSGTPGRLSLWMQRTANARMNRKIRRGRGTFMGMDVLILHTVGRLSGQPRETPVSWFSDGGDGWLIVASGGGSQHPAWFVNLMAHPDQASIELPDGKTVPVMPRLLEGAEREQAWRVVAAAQPRIAKYQSKSERQYPVVRLSPR